MTGATAGSADANARSPSASDVFRLSWPMTIKAVFLHGTIVIDGWLVASLGESALAALGLAAAAGGIALGVLFAFSHAMQIRTAHAHGTGDARFLKSTLVAGLAVNLAISVCSLALLFAFGQPLLNALATSADVASSAWSYLAVFSLVIVFEGIGQCLSSYFNGCGRTRIPLYGYCLSVPINILASVLLIHGLWGLPAFGVAGAALGSALAVAVQVAYFATRLYRSDKQRLAITGWQQQTFTASLTRHAVFAAPIAATFISATVAAHVCTLIYARMSLNNFAAMALVAPWNMLVGQISMQWTQATGILVAQLLGQRAEEKTLDRFLSIAWRGAFVTAVIVSAVFILLCLSINQLYAALEAETRATVLGFLPILVLAAFPRATNAICGNTLRASGDTVYVMHIFISSQWLFRVPATAIAVLVLDVSAFWVLTLLLAEELVKFYPFHRRVWQGDWKRAVISR